MKTSMFAVLLGLFLAISSDTSSATEAEIDACRCGNAEEAMLCAAKILYRAIRRPVVNQCDCVVEFNSGRGDYYFKVYKFGRDIFTSSTSTNTEDEESQLRRCEVHTTRMPECFED